MGESYERTHQACTVKEASDLCVSNLRRTPSLDIAVLFAWPCSGEPGSDGQSMEGNEVDQQQGSGIDALRRSCDTLRTLVEPLSADGLRTQSYATEWSIAQVLSHLGSQGEIFDLCVSASLGGEAVPGREQFEPVWAKWNAKAPEQQAADSLAVDRQSLEMFESMLKAEIGQPLQAFGMQLSPEDVVRMRVSEHAVHTWDIAVVFDPEATVPTDAVELILDRIGLLIAHRGKPLGEPRTLLIETSQPDRRYTLDVGDALTLAITDDDGEPDLRLPAEALVRLAYGRLDPDHTPSLVAHDVDMDQLRSMFPGL